MSVLDETLAGIGDLAIDPHGDVRAKLDELAIPRGSLGRLEELATIYASLRGQSTPTIEKKVVFTMAGDHGVAAEGVSAFPQEVTRQMVANFVAGGAAINVLARHAGARVVVVDCGVAADLSDMPGLRMRKIAYGTDNMAQGPAMSREQAVEALEVGIEVFAEELEEGIDMAATGDMGIANTTPSAAVIAALTGLSVRDVAGRGTGIDDHAFENKVRVIEEALSVNSPDPSDAIDVLAKVGGFEIGAIAGVCLAAARHRVPVVVDGFISTAGASLAVRLKPEITDCLIAGHCSLEAGHRVALEHLGKRPLLDLDMRLGEGTGAVLAMWLAEAGVKIMTEVLTFSQAGVTEGEIAGG